MHTYSSILTICVLSVIIQNQLCAGCESKCEYQTVYFQPGTNRQDHTNILHFLCYLDLSTRLPLRFKKISNLCTLIDSTVQGEKYTFPLVQSPSLPSFGKPSPGIAAAVIVVHGTQRNAEDYYCYMQNSANIEYNGHFNSSVLVLAPHFYDINDNVPSNVLYWDTNSGWKGGDLSTKYYDARISSFGVLDEVLSILTDSSIYPNLKVKQPLLGATAIAAVGFSASLMEVSYFLCIMLTVCYGIGTLSRWPSRTKICFDGHTSCVRCGTLCADEPIELHVSRYG